MNSPGDDHSLLFAALRGDFPSFLRKVYSTLHPGATLQENWHHLAIAHALKECEGGRIQQLLINIQPRSLKSMIVSVAWVAWLLGRDPTLRILCVSYADDLTVEIARLCRNVMRADWYKQAFPCTRLSRETAHELETDAGGYRKAISVAGALTGRGGDIIILDDPMKPEDAASEAGRAAAKRYFSETLSSRFNNQAKIRFVVIMQRLHEDDISGVVLAAGDWHQLKFSTIATEDEAVPIGDGRVHRRYVGDLLQPLREPMEALDRIRNRMGSAAYEAQYQQDPTPAQGNIIRRVWLGRYRNLPQRPEATYTLSWDTALKGDPSCDYSCCTIWCEFEGKLYLVDVYRGKLDFPDLRKKALELHERYRPATILVENKGSGQSLAQELKVSPHFLSVVERNPTMDKVARLAAVAPLFEAGNVFLPEDSSWLAEI